MKFQHIKVGVAAAVAVFTLASCTDDPNSPGVEYMPDMYRSPAVEAYVDYNENDQDYSEIGIEGRISARKPPVGAISNHDQADMMFHMPYALPNTPEAYEAAATSVFSPIPTTEMNIGKGEKIFTRMCLQCHGEAGAGNGSITQTAGGEYPVVPAYQTRKGLEDGKMYHTLQHGKGLMGSHASQLDQEERWLVIQYVRTLMNEEMPEFDENGFAKGTNALTDKMAAKASGKEMHDADDHDHDGHDHEGHDHEGHDHADEAPTASK